MLETGMKGCAQAVVEQKDTARVQGSGTLDVLATPALVALMERCAWQSIADSLDGGTTTVGTAMDLQHTAPTPVGMTIRCESELIAIDRRALTFHIQAFDEQGPIGTAEHQRFIVEAGRFQEKAAAKLHETR